MQGSAGSLQSAPVAEPEAELVEELDVLEQVVVAGPGVAVLVVVPGHVMLWWLCGEISMNK